MSSVNDIIRKRRSVYPAQYLDKEIPREIIEELLENANHAPTHKLTEPWRFKVFMGESKARLGEFLSSKYVEVTPDFVEAKRDKIKANPTKAGALLAIILHRDPKERVPEWEEVASVACAIQNIWIGLDQYGLGGYWSSPGLCQYLNEHVSMEPNETCIGFFYMGYCEPSDRMIKKGAISDKIEWIES
ncbi:nitroreductase family protein [Ekhidna sp.]